MKGIVARTVPLFAIAGALLALGTPAKAARVEQELLNQAPKILAYCEQQGYENVGVLKFRARKGDQPFSDRLGQINSLLATRLEMALILKSNAANPKVGIIRDASAAAAKVPGANHLTPEGRTKLFNAEYDLAWGDKKIACDAFLVGIATLDKSLRSMDVRMGIFDRKTGEIKKIPGVEFTANVDAKDLVEAGETFVMRSAVPRNSRALLKDILEDALDTGAEKVPEPAKRLDVAPVLFEVYYGDKLHPVKSGQVDMPEPREGEKVCFVIKRAASRERLGIVLLVNGENTVFRQKGSPPEASRVWIMDPPDQELRVEGYTIEKPGGGYKLEEFRVASVEESIANHVSYGKDTGTITLVVFRDTTDAIAKADPPPPAAPPGGGAATPPPAGTPPAAGTPPPAGTPPATPTKDTPAPTKDAPKPGAPGAPPAGAPPSDLPNDPPPSGDEVLLRRAAFPKKTPRNLDALQEQLREPNGLLNRGLILPGAQRDTHVDKHPFNRHPVPLMAQTIKYYVPK